MQITFPLQAEQMQIPHLTKNQLMPISWISLGDSITILREYFFSKAIHSTSLSPSWDYYFNTLCLQIFESMESIDFHSNQINHRNGLRRPGNVYRWYHRDRSTETLSTKYCFEKKNEDFTSIEMNSLDAKNSSLNIFFQLPQNICMGLAEIFATIASLEYAYLAAPRSGQTLFMSLQFCSLGISSFIGKGYLSIFTIKENFDFDVRMREKKKQFERYLIEFHECLFLVSRSKQMDILQLFFHSRCNTNRLFGSDNSL